MWQSSNGWIGHLQNIIHEEIESNIRGIFGTFVRNVTQVSCLQLKTHTVTVLPVTLYECAVCSVTRR